MLGETFKRAIDIGQWGHFFSLRPVKEEEKVYTHVTTDVSNTEGNPSDPFNTFFH